MVSQAARNECEHFRSELDAARSAVSKAPTYNDLFIHARDTFAPLWRALADYSRVVATDDGERVEFSCTTWDEDKSVIDGRILFARRGRKRIHPFAIQGPNIMIFPAERGTDTDSSDCYRTDELGVLIDHLRNDLITFLTE